MESLHIGLDYCSVEKHPFSKISLNVSPMAWPAKEEEEGGERKLKTVSRDLHKYLEHHAAHALETFNERSPKIGQCVKVYWNGEGRHYDGTG